LSVAGAAFVLERAADARTRGAVAHTTVASYAATAEANHLATPADDCVGAASARPPS
jgi:3-oxoacyl-(acyl-carrier-protein) synthase